MTAKSTFMDVLHKPVRGMAMSLQASPEVAGEIGQRHLTESLQQQSLGVLHRHAQGFVDRLCDEALRVVLPETQRDEGWLAERFVNAAQRDRLQRAGQHPAAAVAFG